MDSLVQRLSSGSHAVEASLRPERTLDEFEAAIDRKNVHVIFTETEGGTELGFPLDEETSDFSEADFESGTGTAHLEGELELNFVPVRVVADIDLSTLEGTGHLEVIDETAEEDSDVSEVSAG
jgi:hypothetical protein